MIASKYEKLMGSVLTAESASYQMDALVHWLQSQDKWFSVSELTNLLYMKAVSYDKAHIRYILNYLVAADYVITETRKEEWRDESNNVISPEEIDKYIRPYLNETPHIEVYDKEGRKYIINNPRYAAPRLPYGQRVYQVTRAYYKWNVKGV